jgi:hypothetical protein
MAAMDEIAIALQGRNPEANRHRTWRIKAGRDLFGAWRARLLRPDRLPGPNIRARIRIGGRGARLCARRAATPEGRGSALRGRISRRRRLARSAASLGDGQIIERP